MNVSRSVSDVEVASRKLFSRFRRSLQITRLEWPVISATRPLFYFIRLFGLVPFEISQDHFILGSYNVIYSFLCIIVHTYFAYHVLNRFVSIKRGTTMVDITETGKMVFNYFVAIFNILTAVWTRRELIGVLNTVRHFDSRMHDIGYPRQEGAAKIWAWSTCILTTFLWIGISRTGLIAFHESFSNNVTYLMIYMATSMSTIKFSSVVLLLGQRFQQLNKIAQRCKKYSTTRELNIAIDLQVIQRLHNSLMNAGESLSSQYEWSLFFWLMNLFVHSVSNAYMLILWFIVAPPNWSISQQAFFICISLWIIAFIGQLLLLHVACHFTSTEANIIGSIFINWPSSAVGRNCRVESSLYLINRRLNFSAAGCFYVNPPFLCSIAAPLTSYIMLLLQFRS